MSLAERLSPCDIPRHCPSWFATANGEELDDLPAIAGQVVPCPAGCQGWQTVCSMSGRSRMCRSLCPPLVPDALDDTAVRDDAGRHEPDARLREIKVLCLADKSYRRRFPEWKERIGEIVSRASRDFEAAFALKFTITDCRAWDYEAKT